MFWRFIICTSAKAPKRGIRYCVKKDNLNLKQKENYNLLIQKKNRKTTLLSFGAGAVVSLFLIAGGIVNAPKAQGATLADNLPSRQAGLDLARQVVAQVAPVVAPQTLSATSQATRDSSYALYAPDGFISKPLVADTQITPTTVRTSTVRKTTSVVTKVKLDSSGGNHFTWGYCTWYVAERRNVPWFGNAGTWLIGARAAGFATGSTPTVGAIMVTSEGSVGHAAIVDAVNPDGTITVSEMNFRGFGVISSRTIPATYGLIKGFIY